MVDRPISGPRPGPRSERRVRARHPLSGTKLTSVWITVVYLVFGIVALFVSDVVFARYIPEPERSQIQALKGGVEIVLTAGLIFVLTDRRERQLQHSLDRIEQQRQELDVLHRVFRHNLRNDLTVVQGYTDLLRTRSEESAVERGCRKILDTVDDMAEYTEHAARIEGLSDGEYRRHRVDVTDVVHRLAHEYPVPERATVSASVPEHCPVVADPMLEAALAELVANAAEHDDGRTSTITIDVRPGAGPEEMVEIRVADDGPGIPESELTPLEAGTEGNLVHLSGMGLWFVTWTVRHSGGTISFEDNEEGGTTVVIRVPRKTESDAGLLARLRRAWS